MAFGTQPVDFNYFLARKYALLQQQADDGTTNAKSNALQAATGAIVGNASAKLDTARAGTVAADSASQIGLQAAQGNLLREQAKVVAPESVARIGQIGAETAYTGTQNKVLVRDGLTTFSAANPTGALAPVMGAGGYGGYRLPGNTFTEPSVTKPARRAGETDVAYMDRTRWGV